MTDIARPPEDVDRHRRTVEGMSRPGGPLAIDSTLATIHNPAWFTQTHAGWEPTQERQRLHQEIIGTILDQVDERGIPQDRRALILAGPPGAGKGTIQKSLLGEDFEQRWAVVDPDRIKAELLRDGLAKGWFEQLKHPDVRQLEARGERFPPLEFATLVHEESSIIAHQVRQTLLSEGRNVIIDSVLGTQRSAAKVGRQMEQWQYTATVVDVEVDRHTSVASIGSRYARGYEAAMRDPHHLGGRCVPEEYVDTLYPAGQGGPSTCVAAARSLLSHSAVVEYARFEGRPQRCVEHTLKEGHASILRGMAGPETRAAAAETGRHPSWRRGMASPTGAMGKGKATPRERPTTPPPMRRRDGIER